jgi:hypothetical protein
VAGQQLEDLDPVDGAGRVLGVQHRGQGVAGALDVGGGRARPEGHLQRLEVLLGPAGLRPHLVADLADPRERQLALEVLLDELVGLAVELLELVLEPGLARSGASRRAGAARQHGQRQQQRRQQHGSSGTPWPSTVGEPSSG